jgi:hypothetical protein
MATANMLREQMQREIDARKAMELCFKKIRESLEMYKGHLINRIRFHMDRHHTEYLRSVCIIKPILIPTDPVFGQAGK